ncbi:MAG: hypothetical protein WCZ98_01455 [Sideroxydans sp.]
MAKGDLLGMIDCPHCGYKQGMRVTEDKNGEPFGFCETECDGQLRVGGKTRRVEKFYTLHPHLRKRTTAPAPIPSAGASPVAPAKADATEDAPTPTKPKRVGLLIEGAV